MPNATQRNKVRSLLAEWALPILLLGALFLYGGALLGYIDSKWILPVGVPWNILMVSHLIFELWPRVATLRADVRRGRWKGSGPLAIRLFFTEVLTTLGIATVVAIYFVTIWKLGDAGIAPFTDRSIVIFGVFLWPLLRSMTRGHAMVLVFRPFVDGASPSFIRSSLAAAVHPHGRVITLADTSIGRRIHVPLLNAVIFGFFASVSPVAIVYYLLGRPGSTTHGNTMMVTTLFVGLMSAVASYAWVNRLLRFEVSSVDQAQEVARRAKHLCTRWWLRSIMGNPVAVLANLQTWQTAVSALLQTVDAVIIDATRPSKSLHWELERALAILPRERIFVVVDGRILDPGDLPNHIPIPPGVTVIEYGPRGYWIRLRVRMLLDQALSQPRSQLRTDER